MVYLHGSCQKRKCPGLVSPARTELPCQAEGQSPTPAPQPHRETIGTRKGAAARQTTTQPIHPVLRVLTQTPWGILSFELCAYGASCTAMVQSWNSSVQLQAALSLGVDYLFMVAYSATLFLALLMMADHVPSGLRRLTLGFAAAAWLVGAADALENYFLFQILLSPSNPQFARPATASATVKFALLGLTLGWLAFTYLRYGLHQPPKTSAKSRPYWP